MADVQISGGADLSKRNSTPPVAPIQTWGDWTREFMRVQFDKLLLLGLIVGCWHYGYMDGVKASMGALFYALQSNRFKWN